MKKLLMGLLWTVAGMLALTPTAILLSQWDTDYVVNGAPWSVAFVLALCVAQVLAALVYFAGLAAWTDEVGRRALHRIYGDEVLKKSQQTP